MNENICRPKCITSKHIDNVEQKSADKCINEYIIVLLLKFYTIKDIHLSLEKPKTISFIWIATIKVTIFDTYFFATMYTIKAIIN